MPSLQLMKFLYLAPLVFIMNEYDFFTCFSCLYWGSHIFLYFIKEITLVNYNGDKLC